MSFSLAVVLLLLFCFRLMSCFIRHNWRACFEMTKRSPHSIHLKWFFMRKVNVCIVCYLLIFCYIHIKNVIGFTIQLNLYVTSNINLLYLYLFLIPILHCGYNRMILNKKKKQQKTWQNFDKQQHKLLRSSTLEWKRYANKDWNISIENNIHLIKFSTYFCAAYLNSFLIHA